MAVPDIHTRQMLVDEAFALEEMVRLRMRRVNLTKSKSRKVTSAYSVEAGGMTE